MLQNYSLIQTVLPTGDLLGRHWTLEDLGVVELRAVLIDGNQTFAHIPAVIRRLIIVTQRRVIDKILDIVYAVVVGIR